MLKPSIRLLPGVAADKNFTGPRSTRRPGLQSGTKGFERLKRVKMAPPAGSAARFRSQWVEVRVASEQPNGDLRGLKVLVIDDSKTIRRTAETLLSKEGCEVLTAVDGFEALSKIADHKPDIIFVDIMMPRLDGYQTCALIKHNHTFRHTPVIMLSSKDGLFDRARGRIVGSEQYLTKPFTKDELVDAIQHHVHKSAGSASISGNG